MLLAFCLLVLALKANGEEKVVWNGKKGIGKNTILNHKAKGEVKDGLFIADLDGKQWRGASLNWAGFWPKDAGEKIADYKFLVLELKTKGSLQNFAIFLVDNAQKKSAEVKIKSYCKNSQLPKEMQIIKIPTSVFLKKGSKFKTGAVWQIMLHAWSNDKESLTVAVKKIAFSK